MLQENQQTLLSSFRVPSLSEPKLSQLIQLSENGRGHLHTSPSLRCGHQGGEEEPEATGLGGEAGDHLGPPPSLAKGPLQQVGGPYVAVMFLGIVLLFHNSPLNAFVKIACPGVLDRGIRGLQV